MRQKSGPSPALPKSFLPIYQVLKLSYLLFFIDYQFFIKLLIGIFFNFSLLCAFNFLKKMSDSALYEILNALEAREIKAARSWLEAASSGRRSGVLPLFDYLAACRAGNRPPEWETAQQVVFGRSDASRAALRHEMSALTALLRDFLIRQQMDEDPGLKELLLVRALRKRGLEKNFHLAAREAEKALQAPGQRSFSRHLAAFRIDMEKYEWEVYASREKQYSVDGLRASLDAWYAGQLLHLACMEQSQRAVRSQEKSVGRPYEAEAILEVLPGRPHETLPGIALYYLGHRMLANPGDGGHTEAFRLALSRQIDEVSAGEGRDLLMLAVNHGIRRINAGDREAIRQTLGFYRLGLEKKLLHDERGELSKYTYNNVLMSFLALGEWNEARAFLERYRLELPAAERENIYRYNLAVYHFRQGDYAGTLELLRAVSFPDPMYNLESRKMLLKIYYEQEAFDALDSLLENLLNWLRRHGELGYHREMYRNLARFVRRLLHLPPDATGEFRRLEKKIADTPLVAERGWLLEKVRSRG